MNRRVRIGIAGLGRLGRRHAENLVLRTAGAEVVAACSLAEEERAWAARELGIGAVYDDFAALMGHPGIEAVVIVTATQVHSVQVEQALLAGLHVFCEKPLALDVGECERVSALAAGRPGQVVAMGFVRRFDPAHVDARGRIERGEIGRPFLVRTQTGDTDDTAAFQVRFAAQSGGIFFDMNVHDIDLARWLLDAEIVEVYAAGGCYAHPQFGEFGDADNTLALCRMDNGSIACIGASRTMIHGHQTHVEITGTGGSLRIGDTPRRHELEIRDAHGVRVPCVQDFYERFETAFRAELQDFVDCVRQQQPSRVGLADATEASRVAAALRESFQTGRAVAVRR